MGLSYLFLGTFLPYSGHFGGLGILLYHLLQFSYVFSHFNEILSLMKFLLYGLFFLIIFLPYFLKEKAVNQPADNFLFRWEILSYHIGYPMHRHFYASCKETCDQMAFFQHLDFLVDLLGWQEEFHKLVLCIVC